MLGLRFLMASDQASIRKLEKAVAVLGICSGFPRKIPGKSRESCRKNMPESCEALNSRISGTRKGKPAAHLGSTLPRTLSQPSVRGVFEINSCGLLEFSDSRGNRDGLSTKRHLLCSFGALCYLDILILASLGNASLFTKCLFTIFVPLDPPPPNQQSDGFPLDFLSKGPQTELRTLSQNCEQTLQKLQTNRIMNKRAFLKNCRKASKAILRLFDDFCHCFPYAKLSRTFESRWHNLKEAAYSRSSLHRVTGCRRWQPCSC